MVTSKAILQPEIDKRQVDREAQKVENALENAEQMEPQMDMGTVESQTESLGDRMRTEFSDAVSAFGSRLEDVSGPSFDAGGGGPGGDAGPSATETAMVAIQERTLKYQRLSAEEDTERNKILKRAGTELRRIRDQIPALAGGGQQALPGDVEGDGIGGGTGFAAGKLSRGAGLGSLGGVASAASAALPVALTGAVAFKMLQGIERVAEASPAFEAQQEQFSAALRNFRAPFGAAIAEQIAGPNKSLLEASVEFRKAAEQQGLPSAIGDTLEEPLRMLASGNPATRAVGGGTAGALVGGVFGGQLGAAVGGAIGATFATMPWTDELATIALGLDDLGNTIDDFDADIDDLFDDVRTGWPGWPDLGSLWPGWGPVVTEITNSISAFVTPDIIPDFPGWPDIQGAWPGWPEIPEPSISVAIQVAGSLTEWLDQNIDASDVLAQVDLGLIGDGTGGGGGGGGGGLAGGDTPTRGQQAENSPVGGTGTVGGDSTIGEPGGGDIEDVGGLQGDQAGGLVTRGGGTLVHAGEAIVPERQVDRGFIGTDSGTADLDAFLSDLGRTIRQSMRGDDGDGDEVVRTLDSILRELRRTRAATEQLDDRLREVGGSGSRAISR